MSQKKKLKAGLANLFSTPQEPKEVEQPTSGQEPETDIPDMAPLETAEPVIEQPEAIPTVVVEEVEIAEEIVVEAPPQAPAPLPEDIPPAAPSPRPDTPPPAPSPRPDTPLPVPKQPADADEGEEQLVVFTLANEDYGLDISAVESIIKLQPITAVPRASAFIEGITNLRGAVLPVVDLRKRFGMPAEENTKDNRIVVVEVGSTTIGMIVDTVTEVLRVPRKNIAPPSPVVTTIDSNYITGIAQVDDGADAPGRLIVILDLDQLLGTQETGDSRN